MMDLARQQDILETQGAKQSAEAGFYLEGIFQTPVDFRFHGPTGEGHGRGFPGRMMGGKSNRRPSGILW